MTYGSARHNFDLIQEALLNIQHAETHVGRLVYDVPDRVYELLAELADELRSIEIDLLSDVDEEEEQQP